MILVQQSEASSPSLTTTRALYNKVVSDKHKDPIARFGAALGQGFIDAGGRNVTISLQSRVGSRNTSTIVGMVMFCQFWYLYPLARCACLAFKPTGIIALNADLKAPKFASVSNVRPSLFAYPSMTEPHKKELVTKDEKAEAKKDANIEMKSDEPSSPNGNISPINDFISNLADDGKASCVSLGNSLISSPDFEIGTSHRSSYYPRLPILPSLYSPNHCTTEPTCPMGMAYRRYHFPMYYNGLEPLLDASIPPEAQISSFQTIGRF